MTIINAALFQTLLRNTSIPAETAETVIDHAIDLLNTYGAGLSNLGGDTPGSKSLSASSAQAGAIMTLAKVVYAEIYMNASEKTGAGIGALNVGYSSGSQLLSFARQLASRLIGKNFERV